MVPDSSFRSRLRDALRQSTVGRPAAKPDDPSHSGGDVEGGAPPRELRYEPDEAQSNCIEQEQAAWIADALGGWWNRDSGGVCLVVDRDYAADRPHGDAEIGQYAEMLDRYEAALRRFDVRSTPAVPPSLFAALDVEPQPASPSDRPSDLRTLGPSDPRTLGPSDLRTLGPSDPGIGSIGRLLFFDLETTGLSGGAGTCAFLIGYGWFERGGFRTRQFFLSGYAHEPALLRMAAEPLATTGPEPCSTTLASFNGKTFDVPLITGRYLFHRVASPFDDVPHIDLLHPSRRLWRYRAPGHSPADRDAHDAFARYFRATALRDEFQGRTRGRAPGGGLSANAASCALGALEDAVLGFRRTGDVPGAEIPARYFHYVRTGNAQPLAPVLEHNRLDLLSLAALASLVGRMIAEGPQATRDSHECLALGRLYERSGAPERATTCYEQAATGQGVGWRHDPIVQREALRRLAVRHRRERRYEDAAAAWQRLLDLAAAASSVEIEALQALAVHHEHRSKDLHTARAFVMRALDGTCDVRLGEDLRHRLARIDRKLAAFNR